MPLVGRSGPASALPSSFPAVLVAAQDGEPWALHELFARLGPDVLGYLRSQGRRDPDELANDVFLRVFRALPRFSGDETAFRSFVFTVAHHLLVDGRRRAGREPRLVGLDSVPEVIGGDAESEALSALSRARVRELLACLTAAQRDVILLRIVADLPLETVAAAVGRPVGAVKALQRRALVTLRKQEFSG